MSSQLYPKGAENFLDGEIDLGADNIKLLFYSGSYNSAHEFHADLTGGSIVGTSPNLAGKTVTNGVFDANDLTVTGASASAFTHVVLYQDTGSSATSRLIAFFDVASFTPSGDVLVIFHASGLFSIA